MWVKVDHFSIRNYSPVSAYNWPESRIVQNLGRSWSSCCAVIVAQHSAESLAPFNLTVTFINVSAGLQQPVSEPLMISLAVVVAHILCDRVTKRCLSDEDHREAMSMKNRT